MSYTRSAPTVIAAALLLSACSVGQGLSRSGCQVTDGVLNRDDRLGVIFSNHCSSCVAVGFEYVSADGKAGKTACFVPSETRVVHWNAGRYRTIGQFDCDHVREKGAPGVASGTDVMRNHQTGACELLGVFAD